MPALMARPEADEYVPYYSKYISLIPDGDVLEMMASQNAKTIGLLSRIDDTKALYRYAPGKWSIKEVVGHLTDGERVFAYRAMWFAREDRTPLPGFEENDYVPAGRFDRRPLADLLAEFAAVRRASLALFSGFDEKAWIQRGVANESPVSVRALACIILGHEMHHEKLLRERYGL